MDDVGALLRAAGTEVVEALAPSSGAGTRTRYGTVKAVGPTTLDVELAGGTVSGVPMTTACYGARVGDRVMLAVDGPLVTATGILANADNGPYVVLWDSPSNVSETNYTGLADVTQFRRLRLYYQANDGSQGMTEMVDPNVGNMLSLTTTASYGASRIWVSTATVKVFRTDYIGVCKVDGSNWAAAQCSIPANVYRAANYVFVTRIEGWRS